MEHGGLAQARWVTLALEPCSLLIPTADSGLLSFRCGMCLVGGLSTVLSGCLATLFGCLDL